MNLLKFKMEKKLYKNEYLYKHNTEKINRKKFGPIKQIIIRKKESKKNNLHKSYISHIEKIEKIDNDNSILHKSAMIDNNNYNKNPIIKDNFNSDESNSTMKYPILSTTIVKPAIIQQSVLKPIIMPINIRSSSNFDDQYFFHRVINYNDNIEIITDKVKDNNIIDNGENKKENNNNSNNINNIVRRKVIIQKNIRLKDKDNTIKKAKIINKHKNLLLNQPLPKDQNTLIIRKISEINSPNLKFAYINPKNKSKLKMKKESLYNDNNKENISSNININSKDEIKQKDRKEKIKKANYYKTDINREIISDEYKDNMKDNSIRNSMKPIEKINNVTVNNTLKHTYDELIKNKKIVVGLNNYFEKYEGKKPLDSINFKNK